MHLSRDCLTEPEDLALLRAVLRTGAQSAQADDRTKPIVQERFGRASAASEPPVERVRRALDPDRGRDFPSRSAAELTAKG